jgi:hypothetical protein
MVKMPGLETCMQVQDAWPADSAGRTKESYFPRYFVQL